MNKKTCEASYYKFIGSVNCHPKWIRRRISVITSFDESAILETRVVLHAFKFLLKINRTWLAAQSVVDVEISILIGWICLFATLTYYQVWRQNILEIGIGSKQAQLCANSNNNLLTSSCAQNFATTFSR